MPRPDTIPTKTFFKIPSKITHSFLGEKFKGDTTMCCVAGTLTYISDVTGFDRGDYFGNPEQVRAYFKVQVMERLYFGWSKKTGLTQADLDEMAGAVIHHK